MTGVFLHIFATQNCHSKKIKKIETHPTLERIGHFIVLNTKCGVFSSGWPSFGVKNWAGAFFSPNRFSATFLNANLFSC
tara:strand:+ start:562 stop:798 length:237 start_codon:yes stop_codon:yes gene_type:complete